jgi:hypothetical protein
MLSICKRVELTIKTNGAKLSDWAHDEFCSYLTEKARARDFVWCADSSESFNLTNPEPNIFKLDFIFSGQIYEWMDSAEDDILSSIELKYGSAYTEIYMGIEPINFIVTEINIT